MVTPARGCGPGTGAERQLSHRRRWRESPGHDRRWAGRHPGQQRGAVGDRSGHRARVIQRRRQRHDAVERNPPVSGLDRAGPAARRGDPQRAAGVEPRAAGIIRAASAAALPPLEPPATRSSAHGLPTWSVVPPAANSCVWVWPISTMPWSRNRLHATASSVARLPSSIRLEAVRGRPSTAYRSLSPSGIPHSSAASSRSRARRSSAARACSRARSGYRRTQALIASGVPSMAEPGIALLDPAQAGLGQFDRRQPARSQQRRRLQQTKVGRIGFDCQHH